MYRLLLLLASVTVLQALLEQSLSIRGVLRCRNNIPLVNKGVQLYEKRSALLGNALIVGNRTDENGEFYLNGSTSRLLPISPLLHIDSDCKGRSHDVKLPNLKTQITRSKLIGVKTNSRITFHYNEITLRPSERLAKCGKANHRYRSNQPALIANSRKLMEGRRSSQGCIKFL